MSDYRAVASAAVTLRNLLLDAIADTVPGADVKIGPPQEFASHEIGEGLINIFCYTVRPNPTWRNEELVYRRGDGTLIRKPQLALDLHFLLSFYGDDQRNIPLILLGLATAALHADPYPPIRYMPGHGFERPGHDDGVLDLDEMAALSSGESVPLDGSGLAQQHHALRFMMQPFSHNDLSQMWTLFSQVPYTTSVVYVGSVVLIEPDLQPQPSLPVTKPVSHLGAIDHLTLEGIDPQVTTWTRDLKIAVNGRALDSRHLRVLVGGRDAEILERSEERLLIKAPKDLAAGLQSVKVLHGVEIGEDGSVRWVTETDPAYLTLLPRVIGSRQTGSEPATQQRGAITHLAVRMQPAAAIAEENYILLNGRGDASPRGHVLPATLSPDGLDLTTSAEIVPGRYLVRVRVGGVVSRPETDPNPASPTYRQIVGPEITITGPDGSTS